MPSPTSTSDDSEDDRERADFILVDKLGHKTPPRKSSKDAAEDVTGSSTPIIAAVIVVFLAVLALYSSAAPLSPTSGSSFNLFTIIARRNAVGEIARREVREEEEVGEALKRMGEEKGEYNSEPASVLTRTATSGGGNVDFYQSGGAGVSPVVMMFGESVDGEFVKAGNRMGYIWGTSVNSAAWPASSPFPVDQHGVTNVLKSVVDVCEGSVARGQHRSVRKCESDKGKIYVGSHTKYGMTFFRVDVGNDVWEEVRVPKQAESWEQKLLWLS